MPAAQKSASFTPLEPHQQEDEERREGDGGDAPVEHGLGPPQRRRGERKAARSPGRGTSSSLAGASRPGGAPGPRGVAGPPAASSSHAGRSGRAELGDDRRVGDAVVEAGELHAGGPAGCSSSSRRSMAPPASRSACTRVSSVVSSTSSAAMARDAAHDVAVHRHAGDARAQLRQDVLGHDELAHALVAADAGVQVVQADPRRRR